MNSSSTRKRAIVHTSQNHDAALVADLPLFRDAGGNAATEAPEFPAAGPAPLPAGKSMRKLLALAERVAGVDATVLITGESGVGKERLARFIHNASRRRGAPFIAINCGALPEPLFESELFGHARGAFTGAMRDRTGLFEAAHRGTLLLDEVGETPYAMQVKLLRALQERQVRRVGDLRERKIDVRMIAATNRSLADEVNAGRFRADLFYRLKVVELNIPPLRERPEELKELLRVMLARAARDMGRPAVRYSPEAFDRLVRYDWPGNIRELEHAIERACALSIGAEITVEDLPEELRRGSVISAGVIRPLQAVEREYILSVLRHNQGNKTKTALDLGIGAATLFRKLKRYARHS
jgi:two-component system, NtrC family, response regulator HydG